MSKPTCSSLRQRRQRQRRAARGLTKALHVRSGDTLDLLQIMGRGLLGGLVGVLIDALRPARPQSPSNKRGRMP